MEIRPATADDIRGLALVHVRGWQEGYVGQLPQEYLDGISVEARTAMWESLLSSSPGPDVFTAVDDGEIVAFIAVDVSKDEPGTGEVGAIYARQRVWGTGIGRRLMERGVARLEERGCSEAILWVLDTNARARRFYEAGGWTFDGTTKREDIGGSPVIEIRYRRALTSASFASGGVDVAPVTRPRHQNGGQRRSSRSDWTERPMRPSAS